MKRRSDMRAGLVTRLLSVASCASTGRLGQEEAKGSLSHDAESQGQPRSVGESPQAGDGGEGEGEGKGGNSPQTPSRRHDLGTSTSIPVPRSRRADPTPSD